MLGLQKQTGGTIEGRTRRNCRDTETSRTSSYRLPEEKISFGFFQGLVLLSHGTSPGCPSEIKNNESLTSLLDNIFNLLLSMVMNSQNVMKSVK